jgi:hypothetical protein
MTVLTSSSSREEAHSFGPATRTGVRHRAAQKGMLSSVGDHAG